LPGGAASHLSSLEGQAARGAGEPRFPEALVVQRPAREEQQRHAINVQRIVAGSVWRAPPAPLHIGGGTPARQRGQSRRLVLSGGLCAVWGF
jgi:hypothetical protein